MLTSYFTLLPPFFVLKNESCRHHFKVSFFSLSMTYSRADILYALVKILKKFFFQFRFLVFLSHLMQLLYLVFKVFALIKRKLRNLLISLVIFIELQFSQSREYIEKPLTIFCLTSFKEADLFKWSIKKCYKKRVITVAKVRSTKSETRVYFVRVGLCRHFVKVCFMLYICMFYESLWWWHLLTMVPALNKA